MMRMVRRYYALNSAYELGNYYWVRTKYDSAEKYYNTMLAIDPKNSKAFEMLGYSNVSRAFKVGSIDSIKYEYVEKTYKYYSKSIELDSSNYSLYYDRARVIIDYMNYKQLNTLTNEMAGTICSDLKKH